VGNEVKKTFIDEGPSLCRGSGGQGGRLALRMGGKKKTDPKKGDLSTNEFGPVHAIHEKTAPGEDPQRGGGKGLPGIFYEWGGGGNPTPLFVTIRGGKQPAAGGGGGGDGCVSEGGPKEAFQVLNPVPRPGMIRGRFESNVPGAPVVPFRGGNQQLDP